MLLLMSFCCWTHVRCLQVTQRSWSRYMLMDSRAERTTPWPASLPEPKAWTSVMKGPLLRITVRREGGKVFGPSSIFTQLLLQVLGNVPTLQASHMVSNIWTQTKFICCQSSDVQKQIFLLEWLLKDTALKTISGLQLRNKTRTSLLPTERRDALAIKSSS